MDKFDFIINRRSGTVLREGEGEVEKNLREVFKEKAGDIRFVSGAEVAQEVRNWRAGVERREGGEEHGLIIGGGDGTVLTAAEEVMGSGLPLGVLPLGTNNLFSRELGFSADYRKAAEQYEHSTLESVDMGEVNGKHFLVGLLLDKNSVNYFEGREKLRDGDIGGFLNKSFLTSAGILAGSKERLSVKDDTLDTPRVAVGRVFAVTNNALSPRPSQIDKLGKASWKDVAENIFTKERLDGGTLGFYAFRGNALNTMDVIPGLLAGTWDEHKSVTVHKSASMLIDSAQWEDGQEIPIILDGEITRTTAPLKVSNIPGALRVFVP